MVNCYIVSYHHSQTSNYIPQLTIDNYYYSTLVSFLPLCVSPACTLVLLCCRLITIVTHTQVMIRTAIPHKCNEKPDKKTGRDRNCHNKIS